MCNSQKLKPTSYLFFSPKIVCPCIVTDPLLIKPTDALNSNFIVITTLHVSGSLSAQSSGVLSRTSALVHFMQLWWPFAAWSRMELQFHPTPGSKRSQLHKMYHSRCTAKNSWWWAERLPESCIAVIPIKLEFSASVGFIHNVSVTMQGAKWIFLNNFFIILNIHFIYLLFVLTFHVTVEN